MTTNQTIDGVPRELLDKALLDAQRVRFATDKQVIELRELLDKPGPCSHEWTDDGEFTLTCTRCGKTENHEPYGWVQTRGNAINHFTQEWDVVESWEDHGFEYKAMFDHAEQPAQAAVASRDESIAWLKRIDGIGQNRAELIYSMGFRRHTDVPQS